MSGKAIVVEPTDSEPKTSEPIPGPVLEYVVRLCKGPIYNPVALASAICGSLSVVVPLLTLLPLELSGPINPIALIWFLLAMAGVILGIIGLRQCGNRDTSGRSRCILGLEGGGCSLVVILLLAPFWFRPNVSSQRLRCISNLRQIGQAIMFYAQDNGGRFPDYMDALISQIKLDAEVFVCPSSKDVVAPGQPAQQASKLSTPGFCSYVYLGAGLNAPVPLDTIIAYERLENHKKEGMHVIYADGHAEWIKGSEAERILAELNTGHNPPRPAGIGI